MSDRTTRGTPAFRSSLWDTTGIPPLEEAPRAKAVIRTPASVQPELSTGFYVTVLIIFVLVAVAACNVGLWLLQPIKP